MRSDALRWPPAAAVACTAPRQSHVIRRRRRNSIVESRGSSLIGVGPGRRERGNACHEHARTHLSRSVTSRRDRADPLSVSHLRGRPRRRPPERRHCYLIAAEQAGLDRASVAVITAPYDATRRAPQALVDSGRELRPSPISVGCRSTLRLVAIRSEIDSVLFTFKLS